MSADKEELYYTKRSTSQSNPNNGSNEKPSTESVNSESYYARGEERQGKNIPQDKTIQSCPGESRSKRPTVTKPFPEFDQPRPIQAPIKRSVAETKDRINDIGNDRAGTCGKSRKEVTKPFPEFDPQRRAQAPMKRSVVETTESITDIGNDMPGTCGKSKKVTKPFPEFDSQRPAQAPMKRSVQTTDSINDIGNGMPSTRTCGKSRKEVTKPFPEFDPHRPTEAPIKRSVVETKDLINDIGNDMSGTCGKSRKEVTKPFPEFDPQRPTQAPIKRSVVETKDRNNGISTCSKSQKATKPFSEFERQRPIQVPINRILAETKDSISDILPSVSDACAEPQNVTKPFPEFEPQGLIETTNEDTKKTDTSQNNPNYIYNETTSTELSNGSESSYYMSSEERQAMDIPQEKNVQSRPGLRSKQRMVTKPFPEFERQSPIQAPIKRPVVETKHGMNGIGNDMSDTYGKRQKNTKSFSEFESQVPINKTLAETKDSISDILPNVLDGCDESQNVTKSFPEIESQSPIKVSINKTLAETKDSVSDILTTMSDACSESQHVTKPYPEFEPQRLIQTTNEGTKKTDASQNNPNHIYNDITSTKLDNHSESSNYVGDEENQEIGITQEKSIQSRPRIRSKQPMVNKPFQEFDSPIRAPIRKPVVESTDSTNDIENEPSGRCRKTREVTPIKKPVVESKNSIIGIEHELASPCRKTREVTPIIKTVVETKDGINEIENDMSGPCRKSRKEVTKPFPEFDNQRLIHTTKEDTKKTDTSKSNSNYIYIDITSTESVNSDSSYYVCGKGHQEKEIQPDRTAKSCSENRSKQPKVTKPFPEFKQQRSIQTPIKKPVVQSKKSINNTGTNMPPCSAKSRKVTKPFPKYEPQRPTQAPIKKTIAETKVKSVSGQCGKSRTGTKSSSEFKPHKPTQDPIQKSVVANNVNTDTVHGMPDICATSSNIMITKYCLHTETIVQDPLPHYRLSADIQKIRHKYGKPFLVNNNMDDENIIDHNVDHLEFNLKKNSLIRIRAVKGGMSIVVGPEQEGKKVNSIITISSTENMSYDDNFTVILKQAQSDDMKYLESSITGEEDFHNTDESSTITENNYQTKRLTDKSLRTAKEDLLAAHKRFPASNDDLPSLTKRLPSKKYYSPIIEKVLPSKTDVEPISVEEEIRSSTTLVEEWLQGRGW